MDTKADVSPGDWHGRDGKGFRVAWNTALILTSVSTFIGALVTWERLRDTRELVTATARPGVVCRSPLLRPFTLPGVGGGAPPPSGPSGPGSMRPARRFRLQTSHAHQRGGAPSAGLFPFDRVLGFRSTARPARDGLSTVGCDSRRPRGHLEGLTAG